MASALPIHRSIRLKNYDYSTPGVYFVTICSSRRQNIFGIIRDAKIVPSTLGRIIELEWAEIPRHFPSIVLDAFMLMPNHLHGILVANRPRAEASSAATKPPSLSHVIQSFKSRAWRAAAQAGLQRPFWQRNYFEHIVRSGRSLTKIQQYIWDNPIMWQFDRENPSRTHHSPHRYPWEH